MHEKMIDSVMEIVPTYTPLRDSIVIQPGSDDKKINNQQEDRNAD
jgi:hypothetical protein